MYNEAKEEELVLLETEKSRRQLPAKWSARLLSMLYRT